ncbi:MAG: RsiV family protein, partial [Ignavibacteria bacterium]
KKGDLFSNKISFKYNVAVTKDGVLEFYYNPYEIAPYVVGPITVSLTKAELGTLIGTGSLLN